MARVASNTAQGELNRIKKNVEKSYEYYRKNYERYNEFRKFIFATSLSDDDISMLQSRKMPQIEFNISEAYLSRLVGEYSKQEPSVMVGLDDGAQVNPDVVKVSEGHIRHILFDANKNGMGVEVYKEQLSGGFSVGRVSTKYANEKSFTQIICVEKSFDPTLCGFDTLARYPTKHDGRYCFEFYPKLKEDFLEEYPGFNLEGIAFLKDQQGFNWSYSTEKNDVLLLCDYYEKKKKKAKIVKIASVYPNLNNKVMTMDEYEDMLIFWEKQQIIAQPPAIIGKPRDTTITTIDRYLFVENTVIKYEKTNFKFLPLVYFPGNDIIIRDSVNGTAQQMTRPYAYHLKGAQKLKNFAGQNLANELENMVQHKWIAPLESIPEEEDWLKAWTDPQQASVFVYNAFDINNPDKQLPPPREIQRAPIPQEIGAAFTMMDNLTQQILGSYDASLGINDNQLSGVAIVEGATQSNAAAMPYIISNLMGQQQIAEIIIDLMPKYYVTPMTIPITNIEGKKSFIKLNQPGGLSFNYDENALHVKVEAGVNFSIQKNKALQQIIALQQSSPLFAQFMQEVGLEVILDNVEIRGIDYLKQMAAQWLQQQKQKQAQAQQMQQQAMMNSPQMINAKTNQQKLMLEAKKADQDSELKSIQIGINKQDADTNRMKVFGELGVEADNITIQHEKSQAENVRSAADLAMKNMEMVHKHNLDNQRNNQGANA